MVIPGCNLITPVCDTGHLALYRATCELDGRPFLRKVPVASWMTPTLLHQLEREYALARNLESSRTAPA